MSMQRINWYPNYWTFIEKNKLFDFWRSRYAKNQINFSPNQLTLPVDFFDASYESLKTASNVETEREWQVHKGVMEARLREAGSEDKRRLKLQYFAEIKAYEYWMAKVVLRPVEEDEVGILKDTLWLINERERAFKEAFGQLIEYDRQYYSPLSYPERDLTKQPINISEAYHWLTRNNLPLQIMQDIDFFQSKKNKIQPIDEALLGVPYLPTLLTKRHDKALAREKSKGYFRSLNGEILREENRTVDMFTRPEQVYAQENNDESILQQIENLKNSGNEKYKLNTYNNTIKILDTDKYHLTFSAILKDKGSHIPRSPYALIQKKLFEKIEQGSSEDREEIFLALKSYVEKRKRGEFSPQPQVAKIEEEEAKKGNIFSSLLYFYQNKKGDIEIKPTEGTFVNPEKVIQNDGLYFLEVEDKKDIEDLLPDYVDDFDDKTRSRFFRKDMFGLKFDREKVLKQLLKPLQGLKHNGLTDKLNALKSVLGKGLNKKLDDEISQSLEKQYKPSNRATNKK